MEIHKKPLTIFVHRASECLTDHLPHGDGLICFSLLSELARRGHRIIACTNHNGVTDAPANLDIREQKYKIPANSLGDWELGLRANQLLCKIEKKETVDIVWRMHPYEGSSPIVPYTNGRPLVMGPLFLGWPKQSVPASNLGKPRFGIGIRGILDPFARKGWRRTLRKAALVLCATDSLSEQTRALTDGKVITLPVIVDPPDDLVTEHQRSEAQFKLLFVANLYANKNPLVFCQTIKLLRDRGISATGEILGDGPERTAMTDWCKTNGMSETIVFLGRLPNVDVYRHLATADGLISTSFGEPYGRSIAEAMSAGAVPICHNSGGPRDFINSGVDGLLVDRVNAIDYADAIAKWTGPAWLELSLAARKKATQWRTNCVADQLERALHALPLQGSSR
jgi:glycosyltransferase involved in cell wall biosynthesis